MEGSEKPGGWRLWLSPCAVCLGLIAIVVSLLTDTIGSATVAVAGITMAAVAVTLVISAWDVGVVGHIAGFSLAVVLVALAGCFFLELQGDSAYYAALSASERYDYSAVERAALAHLERVQDFRGPTVTVLSTPVKLTGSGLVLDRPVVLFLALANASAARGDYQGALDRTEIALLAARQRHKPADVIARIERNRSWLEAQVEKAAKP